jgi:hypothetical protein
MISTVDERGGQDKLDIAIFDTTASDVRPVLPVVDRELTRQ